MRLKINQALRRQRPVTPSFVVGTEINVEFPRTERPAFTDSLRFPDDVTELTAANVSDLHGKYTKLMAFCNQSLAAVNIQVLRLETKESLVKNNLYRSRPSMNTLDKWRRDMLISEDPAVEQIYKAKQGLQEKKELLTMLMANYERYCYALSRELSRKGFDKEPGRF